VVNTSRSIPPLADVGDDPTAGQRQRRPRGSTKDYPTVYGKVSRDAKDILAALRDNLGVAEAQALEFILLAFNPSAGSAPRATSEGHLGHAARPDETCSVQSPRVGTTRRGRPSKGERESLITRVPPALAAAARERATELNLTVSDYIQGLIVHNTN
jgi:hypothetical protein